MPAERNRLTLMLDGERKTEIATDIITERLAKINERAEAAYPGGMLLGMTNLPPRKQLALYISMTMHFPSDIDLINDPDYTEKLAAGLAPLPRSTFWINALNPPEDFEQMAREFRNLLKEYLP